MTIRFIALLFAVTFSAFAAQPFQWDWKTDNGTLTVTLRTEPGSYVYRDKTSVLLDSQKPSVVPVPAAHEDSIMGRTEIYKGENIWRFSTAASDGTLTVVWQGCRADKGSAPLCYPPETVSLKLKLNADSSGTLYPKPENVSRSGAPPELYPDVVMERSAFGYLNAKEFTAFLENRQTGFLSFADKGIVLVLLLTLLGGLALNLTPCVLPMIPINLAIIGADTGSRRAATTRGFVYAAGIAVAYGSVGLAAVLGGATFGTLGSYWYFNLGAAVVFLLLGLSMFGVFTIDLSRYGGGIRTPSTAKLAGVFLLGGLSALLAGACVAPVVIAVLLHAANLYAAGNPFGLVLPFLLGIGMGLPWPLAAAGLARLPKPGVWMVRVKQAFGILIILTAVYYGWLGIRLLTAEHTIPEPEAVRTADVRQQLDDAFLESVLNGKPVLIDFWAEWCKNCKAMDLSTMRDPEVRAALSGFNVVKLDATRISPDVKAVMERFKITGLPAFVIVRPAQ